MYHDIKTPSIIRKKITVKSFAGGLLKNSTENLDDLSRSVLSYNFDYSTGELKRGAGMKKIDGFNVSALSKVSILGVYYYKRYSHEKGKRIENWID